MRRHFPALALILLSVFDGRTVSNAQEPWRFILPGQRRFEIRDPASLPKARLPEIPPPPTVRSPPKEVDPLYASLDEAIHTALENSDVIRVLAGVEAVASGRTIYDPAIANTQIDEARAPFDPAIGVDNRFGRSHLPVGTADPDAPLRVGIAGDPVFDYEMSMDLAKRTGVGGTAGLRVRANSSLTRGLAPLNPRSRSAVELSYLQPLLQGGGYRANVAPILIARIDTERSFFQMKDSIQQSVFGVVQAYWSLVSARTDVWVRRQQVEQGQEAFNLAQARMKVGLGTLGDVSQARSALAGFRAGLVTARGDAILREDALRNILGLPPSDGQALVPDTPPATDWVSFDWDALVEILEQLRPDVIELKLILEADQQEVLLARNQARPRVDAVALYRWNGLAGFTPDRRLLASGPGEFREWELGVNFSVPIGLRQERAALRRRELVVFRDRANLQQGLHEAVHQLAIAYRNVAQFYSEYEALKEARAAARVNLEAQLADYRAGRTIYLNVLQAITDWGDAVSAESQSLARYNVALADVELRTGTILESHGVRFVEERYASIGPLRQSRCYPMDLHPQGTVDRYERTRQPAEEIFELQAPVRPGRARPSVPSPRPEPVVAPEPEPPGKIEPTP